MGARTVQDDDQLVEKMRLFGEYIGMAFKSKTTSLIMEK